MSIDSHWLEAQAKTNLVREQLNIRNILQSFDGCIVTISLRHGFINGVLHFVPIHTSSVSYIAQGGGGGCKSFKLEEVEGVEFREIGGIYIILNGEEGE